MQFKIEKISEDSFYLNLLLGLPRIINRYRKYGVKGHYLKRFPALNEDDICVWEHDNAVLLPSDLRKFYTSTNGFLFRWAMSFGKEDADVIGTININGLGEFVRTLAFDSPPEVYKDGQYSVPQIGSHIKAFELVTVGSVFKIIMVYSRYKFANHVWIYTKNNQLSYLTSDFTTYFKMCISHLGIPNWQLLYTPDGPPQWSHNVISLLAPHLLRSNAKKDEQPRRGRVHKFTNKLDQNIFKPNFVLHKEDPRFSPKRKVVEKEKPGKSKTKK